MADNRNSNAPEKGDKRNPVPFDDPLKRLVDVPLKGTQKEKRKPAKPEPKKP